MTLISTKNIDLSNAHLDAKLGQRQTAKHCAFILLGLIPFGVPNLEATVDRALEAGKGNIMIDEVTWMEWYWLVVGRLECIKVEGTVLTTPAGKPPGAKETAVGQPKAGQAPSPDPAP